MKLTKNFLVMAMLLALCLTGCSLTNENETVEELFLVLTEEDFIYLEDYPNLKKLDLSGTTCYDAILAYIESHPQVDVTYTISLGTQEFPSDTTELTLEEKDFDFDELMTNLAFLPNVTCINLPDVYVSGEQLAAIAAAHPAITVNYSLELRGNLYEANVTELNLAGMTSEEVADVAAALPAFTAVTYVELMDENGRCNLTKTDVKMLQDALPTAVFNYSFELFGRTVSTSDASIEFYDTDIGNGGEDTIREALDILTACTYFKLDDCGVSSAVMAGIRDDYPDVKVVWRIRADYFTMCTDETMLYMSYDLDEDECSELKYCTDVTHLDINNNALTDISFIKYMPNLECVIISSNRVTDISPLADHDNLQWLEMAHCYYLEDISSLSTCDNLKYLNVSHTNVSDLSALENLPLERFVCISTNVTAATETKFQQWHPDCLTRFEGETAFGYGWRYDDTNRTMFDYYAQLRKIFRYDEAGYYGNKKEQ